MIPTAENLNMNEKTIQQPLDGFSYVLVPAALYQDNDKEKYLEFLGVKDENSVVCADYIELADAYIVYCTDNEANASHHALSVLLEDLIKENQERTEEPRIYLNIKDKCYDMIVLKGAKIIFLNSFRFKTKEDFLYFLLFAIEQLHLEPESVPVYFMGMITEDSKIVELTARYVRDIRFKKDIRCE